MYLLLYSKRPPWSHGFNAKIGLKNRPPWAEIFTNIFLDMAHQTKPQPNYRFSQISQHKVGCFSNRFLSWNCEIKTVVLSMSRGTNKVKKIRNFCPQTYKITSKTQNCRKPRPDKEKGSNYWDLTKVIFFANIRT